MDIRLNAKLSAYSKVPAPEGCCSKGTVSNEDIDKLFAEESYTPTPVNNRISNTDIDKLFAST